MGKTITHAENLNQSLQKHKSKQLWKKITCLGESLPGFRAALGQSLAWEHFGKSTPSNSAKDTSFCLPNVLEWYSKTALFSPARSLPAQQTKPPKPGFSVAS